MAITSIGNDPASVAAELLQRLGRDLGDEVGASRLAGSKDAGSRANAVPPGGSLAETTNLSSDPSSNPPPGATPGASSLTQVASYSNPSLRLVPLPRLSDVAHVLMAEVASSDIGKLTKILDPAPDTPSSRILETLLVRAVQEVVKGNAERAVGYLADYVSRDPRRAESLPLEPELAPIRDKIDSLVSRMTIVARMSAEDGLSRAEQKAGENAGKLSNWDTHADVLIKLAHRFFDAGGYANYSRTSELARVVGEAVPENKPVAHALAASASASAAGQMHQLSPGNNVPYWTSPEIRTTLPTGRGNFVTPRRLLTSPLDDVLQNLRELKELAVTAVTQVWRRAPLLVMLLVWLFAGLFGGVAFSIASRVWPDSGFIGLGNFAFNIWGIGFLALVGFGFYMRVRRR